MDRIWSHNLGLGKTKKIEVRKLKAYGATMYSFIEMYKYVHIAYVMYEADYWGKNQKNKSEQEHRNQKWLTCGKLDSSGSDNGNI